MIWLLKVAYIVFTLIFSFISTSSVVYSIAYIYTGEEVNFKEVISVVPKVWKRLMVTFLSIFVAFFAYNIVAKQILILWVVGIRLVKIGILINFFVEVMLILYFGWVLIYEHSLAIGYHGIGVGRLVWVSSHGEK